MQRAAVVMDSAEDWDVWLGHRGGGQPALADLTSASSSHDSLSSAPAAAASQAPLLPLAQRLLEFCCDAGAWCTGCGAARSRPWH